ncbi:MAG TPA: hypothetical protein VFC19_16165 [Candidatus Limnocylindrales bacterium]|nr:hypothetical protein [Candidatus Limnocylindrales bacterium]
MGKGGKRRERQAKKRRARDGRSAGDSPQVQSMVMSIERASAVFAHYVRLADSFEEAARLARADLVRAAAQVRDLACGLDLITVVSSVRVSMIMNRATSGRDVSAAILELIAMVLAARPVPTSGSTDTAGETSFMPPHCEAAAQHALAIGGVIALFDTPPSDPYSNVLFSSIQREILLRNPVYPHMLLDSLRGIFNDPAVDDDCRAALGFTGLEAVNVMEAVRMLSIEGLADRFTRMEAVRERSMPYLRDWRRRGDSESRLPKHEHRAVAQELFEAIEGLTTNISGATVIDLDAVAMRTGYDRAVVQAVLDLFTLPEVSDLEATLERFFRGDNPLRTAPIVSDGQGRRMLVHDGLGLSAVREVIEAKLMAAQRWERYKAHRGAWTENTAIDLLSGALPTATVYRGFNYFVPDPKAATPQTEPNKYTKRVEGDGLLLIDDIALIIEVKSVALTAEARGGVARKLRGKLRDIVTDAADQAGRLRQRIVEDRRIRVGDDEWIDVSGIREVHTIAVGLEDLSGVTTATIMLLDAGILAPDHIPWTVSIHDLRIVCELLERPSELLLYLRRRTEPLATWKFRAVDELDLFLLFLRRGLYVQPNPHQVAEELPWSGPPSVSDLRRYSRQHPEIVTSHTEPLDAWYDSQLDPDAPRVDKPGLVADPGILQLVDAVALTVAPGWLPTATCLLEGDSKAQRKFGRYACELAKLVHRDSRHHSVTHLMGESSTKQNLLVWACLGPNEDADTAATSLLQYLQAKKHQSRAHRAACMVFDSTGTQLLRLIYDNRPNVADPELDLAAEHLVPLEKMRETVPYGFRSARRRS